MSANPGNDDIMDVLASHERRLNDHDDVLRNLNRALTKLVRKLDKWEKIAILMAGSLLANGAPDVLKLVLGQ